MPILDKSSKKTLLLSICVFILSGLLHASPFKIKLFIDFPTFYTFLYSGVIIIWIISLSRRIINKKVRKYLLNIGLLMLFWYYLHFLKFEYFTENILIERILWYAYYIPITLLPLMSFFAAIHIGKHEGLIEQTAPKRKLHQFLYIPAAILIIMAITNESHQLFFEFKEPIEQWKTNYCYGIGYFLTMIWATLLSTSALIIVFYKCKISSCKKYTYLLAIPLLVGILFLILYGMKIRWVFFVRMYRLSEIVGFMVIGMWEACIQIGLIPSNSSYPIFFEHSTISAQIMDANNDIIYCSKESMYLTKEQINALLSSPILIEEGIKISSKRIPGGMILWEEDISYIDNLNKELSRIKEELKQENELIHAENELMKKNKKIVERNKLYEEIAQSMSFEVSQISKLIHTEFQNEQHLKKTLAKACIYKAYIKRKSNLELIAQNSEWIPIYELENSIRESVDYLNIYGITSYIHRQQFKTQSLEVFEPIHQNAINNEDLIQSEASILAYDLFQEVIERMLPKLSDVLVNLNFSKDRVILKINLESNGKLTLNGWNESKFKRLNMSKKIHSEDDTIYVTLHIPIRRAQ